MCANALTKRFDFSDNFGVMLSTVEKEDVVATFVIELDRMMAIIRNQYRRTKEKGHQEFISQIEENWKSCLKAESKDLFTIVK